MSKARVEPWEYYDSGIVRSLKSLSTLGALLQLIAWGAGV